MDSLRSVPASAGPLAVTLAGALGWYGISVGRKTGYLRAADRSDTRDDVTVETEAWLGPPHGAA